MTDGTLSLTIDGLAVQCPAGSTVYEAATAAGIHIPTFCHHPTLVPVGACRMCLVEIEGVRGLQTSCSTPARDGMVVKVHTSETAVKARRANIEFLLTNHPLDCPVCDKGGECPLQDQAMADGPGKSRYVEEKRHKNKRYPLGELIVLDQERCVLCWRCIRFLDEWAGDHQLDLFGRGATTRLDTFPGRPLTSKWQGNTIDICPVGALTSRDFRFEARVWELTNTPSICPMCPVGCNIVVGAKNNEIRRIVPRENPEVNERWICDRGRFTSAYVDDPERLGTPLIRRDGVLQPATWDEALDLIAGRLQTIVAKQGPEAIGGLGSTRATNEANYLFQRFLRTVAGSNNVDHLGRMPAGVTPLESLPELERKDTILLLGLDPSTEAPLVELWIKKAVLRHGAKVIAVHPRRIELSQYGTWLGYRPGSEAALLNGLSRAILEAGTPAREESRQGAGTRASNLEEFRNGLKDFGAGQVEAMTGAAAADLRAAAEKLAGARRPAILYGSLWAQGGTSRAALDNLSLLLGGIEAGFVAQGTNSVGALEMGVVPDRLPGRQPFADQKVRSRLAGLWGGRISPVAGLDFEGMMAAARKGKLQALWVMGADPATERYAAREALGQIPFLVVQELFLTVTAERADVVLPATSFAETNGTYTNLTGRLQAIRACKRPPGLARPDWWILAATARRIVDSKHRRTWEFSGSRAILAEISRALPGYRDVNMEALGLGERGAAAGSGALFVQGGPSLVEGGMGWQPARPQPAVRRAFSRVEPASSGEARGGEYPLVLVPGRLIYDRGTLLRRSDRIQNLVPDPFVAIHPAEATGLGLADGEEVWIESAQGRVALRLRVDDGVVRGVAFAPVNLGETPLSALYPDDGSSPRVRIVK